MKSLWYCLICAQIEKRNCVHFSIGIGELFSLVISSSLCYKAFVECEWKRKNTKGLGHAKKQVQLLLNIYYIA